MPETPSPRSETICARPPAPPRSDTHPLVPPLYLSVVYKVDDLQQIDDLYDGRASGSIYARDGHPNASMLASKIAELERGEAALVCASGMGAEAAMFLSNLEAGDHVALSEGLYGKTVALVGRELARFGVTHSFFDGTRPDTLRASLRERTRIVFVETLSNPLVRLADLGRLAELTHKAGAQLVVDHTFAPLLCHPLTLGADAVTHSGTKLIGGHSDLTLGLLVGSNALIARAGPVASTFGLTGNPFESWMALRGLATLAIRSERACANALELAGRLERHPATRSVRYPGLASHPDHDRATEMLTGGFGTICTIDVGDRARADTLIQSLEHIPFAPSLGDVATTLSHPATTSHRALTPEQRTLQGITPGLVRLSIGLESVDDLWKEMERALDLVEKST
jgi:cystathionine beta-lyase/cystathionine gamma-synthase